MEILVIDVETKKTFAEIEKRDPALLGISYVGVYSYQEDRLFGFFENELNRLWPYFNRSTTIIGYNIDNFDLPTFRNYYPSNLRELQTLDLLKVIKEATGIRLKLDVVAKTNLGKGKIGNGLDAIRYYHQQEWSKLAKYCLEDVAITRDLYEYLKKNKRVSYPDLRSGNIITVPVNLPPITPPPVEQKQLF